MLTDLQLWVDGTNYYAPDTVTDTDAGVWIESMTIAADNNSIVSFECTLKGNGTVAFN